MTNLSPPGWPTVIPRIFSDDAEALVAFITGVFEAQGDFHQDRPCELRIGDSMLMVSSGEVRGSYAACLYIYVADVEVCFAKAVAAGAEVIEAPLVTPYGDRRAVIRDRWGNMWQIAEYRNR